MRQHHQDCSGEVIQRDSRLVRYMLHLYGKCVYVYELTVTLSN